MDASVFVCLFFLVVSCWWENSFKSFYLILFINRKIFEKKNICKICNTFYSIQKFDCCRWWSVNGHPWWFHSVWIHSQKETHNTCVIMGECEVISSLQFRIGSVLSAIIIILGNFILSTVSVSTSIDNFHKLFFRSTNKMMNDLMFDIWNDDDFYTTIKFVKMLE